MIYYDIFNSDFGEIAIIGDQLGLLEVAFQQGNAPASICASFAKVTKHSPTYLNDAKNQLFEYFEGKRQTFALPLAQQGTSFQLQVWQALTSIEYGTTLNYGQLAKRINNPKAVRAVGTANGANKLAIIVPCHRVIGANKTLTGYAGGMGLKAKLLMLEGAQFKV